MTQMILRLAEGPSNCIIRIISPLVIALSKSGDKYDQYRVESASWSPRWTKIWACFTTTRDCKNMKTPLEKLEPIRPLCTILQLISPNSIRIVSRLIFSFVYSVLYSDVMGTIRKTDKFHPCKYLSFLKLIIYLRALYTRSQPLFTRWSRE